MVPTRHSLKLVMISQCFRTKNRKIHCSKKLGTLLKMYIKFYTSCFISGNISIQLSGMSLNIQFINFTHGWFQLLHNVSRITAHPEKWVHRGIWNDQNECLSVFQGAQYRIWPPPAAIKASQWCLMEVMRQLMSVRTSASHAASRATPNCFSPSGWASSCSILHPIMYQTC